MYPLFRLLSGRIRAAFKDKVSIGQAVETTFYCRPWDLDMFMEMNNGRVLTLYDLGRFELAARSGLMTVLRQQRWGLVVAGASVRYRKRVKLFDKVTMHTQIAGFDERWIYIVQSMWVRGEATSSVLLRTGVTHRGKVIPSVAIKQAMNQESWELAPTGWVKEWIDSEEHRQWPPARGND